jgi:acyl-CoA thioester hydrolase
MPRTYTRPFRVRYYECDPYRHVNNATYLRYATQTAIEASADAGYDNAKYAELGATWFIREAGIDYARPARENDTLNVKTWVHDFRRVRSRRDFEMTLAGSGEVVVRAFTDWVYLDAQTNRPVRIPAELIAAFFPEGPPPAAPRRDPFPEMPAPPPGAFTTQRRVAWHQLDTAGHLNSAWYLSLMEDTALEAARHAGWPLTRVTEHGFALYARQHRIEYLRPALFGEELCVTTYLSVMRRSTALRHYLVELTSGESVARAQTVWVCVDAQTGRPAPIPPEWQRDFAGQLAST